MTYQYNYLHGLFGEGRSPDDRLICLDTYSFKGIQKDTLKQIFFVYSMGGRVLLENIKQEDLKYIEHVYFFSVNIGVEDRLERRRTEDKLLKNLTKRKVNSFWNGLSLFNHDEKIVINKNRIKFYRKIFNKFRASSLEDNFKKIKLLEDKCTFFLGEFDRKYIEKYKRLNLPFNIVKGAGHRGVLKEIPRILERYYDH